MTSITRYRPSSDLATPRKNRGSLLRDFFGDSFLEGSLEDTGTLWVPRVDLSETDESFFIDMDLPGLSKSDVDVSFENGKLLISGERNEEHTDEKPQFHRIERVYGRFSRTFNLGMAVKVDNITASFENGVLHIEVPKAEEIKPVRVKIA